MRADVNGMQRKNTIEIHSRSHWYVTKKSSSNNKLDWHATFGNYMSCYFYSWLINTPSYSLYAYMHHLNGINLENCYLWVRAHHKRWLIIWIWGNDGRACEPPICTLASQNECLNIFGATRWKLNGIVRLSTVTSFKSCGKSTTKTKSEGKTETWNKNENEILITKSVPHPFKISTVTLIFFSICLFYLLYSPLLFVCFCCCCCCFESWRVMRGQLIMHNLKHHIMLGGSNSKRILWFILMFLN